MTNTECKTLLLEACRNKLLSSIRQLEAAMNDAQQQANEYGPPRDRYDAFRTQLMRKRDMMAEQLDKELNELKILDRIDPKKILDTAAFGAVVLTNDQNYFVAVSQGKIETDGRQYITISARVPIFQAMQGKQKNDLIEFRGIKSKITDIF